MQVPLQIENRVSSNTLELTWDDNTNQVFSAATLRRHCQCADCKSLRRHAGEVDIAESIGIWDIRLIGTYAVQFVFSDGHERGIYPWEYLKSLAA